MKGPFLNRVHRYVGIVIAPFLVVQTLSGLLLNFGMFRRSGSMLPGNPSMTNCPGRARPNAPPHASAIRP